MTNGKIFVISFFLAAEALLVEAQDTLALPSPRYHGETSVEQALNSRKTIRQFKEEAIELEELSQLLWAAGGGSFDGVTRATRTYPSAGGIYPLGIYVVAGRVVEVDPGVYEYLWRDHALKLVKRGDFRSSLARAALLQVFYLPGSGDYRHHRRLPTDREKIRATGQRALCASRRRSCVPEPASPGGSPASGDSYRRRLFRQPSEENPKSGWRRTSPHHPCRQAAS